MKIRTKILLSLTLLTALGFYFLIDWILKDVKPRYRQVIEESLIDTSNTLATIIELELEQGDLDVDTLRSVFARVYERRFQAKIYEYLKDQVDLRVYVTDQRGIVIFDSVEPDNEGSDFSKWNDVARTLMGSYGARTTRDNPDDPQSTVLYVAAPIHRAEEIVGAVTVAKPTFSSNELIANSQWKILIGAMIAFGLIILAGVMVTIWLTSPVEKLAGYARAVGRGEKPEMPKLSGVEIVSLGEAFEEMRDALEGKRYVEQYVQSLTHEIKSPLSAISGAVELLNENMPEAQRAKFLSNITLETERLKQIVVRVLELATIESRKAIGQRETVNLSKLIDSEVELIMPILHARGISVEKSLAADGSVSGEKFLLSQAIRNLLINAADFSPDSGVIKIMTESAGDLVRVIIEDQGPGIPDYAIPRLFERFFSTLRPSNGTKGTGLGLNFVKEIAELHSGGVKLENRKGGGARATLTLPRHAAASGSHIEKSHRRN